MEIFADLVFSNVQAAPWIIFFLLMLAGLNFPISEDLMVILSGVMAAQKPEFLLPLYFAAFLGAFLSDWEAYWIGRLLGPKIVRVRWFSRVLPEERLLKIHDFYARFGFLTLLIGRFIPFGIRNCLFMTAGVGKMSFLYFVISDGIACFISCTALFYFSYSCGQNYQEIYATVSSVSTTLLIPLVFFLFLVGYFFYSKKRKRGHNINA